MYHIRWRKWKNNVYIYGWLISVLFCETLGGISWVKKGLLLKNGKKLA